MPRADHLTVIYDDDTTEPFTDVRYCLTRDGVRILAEDGEHTRTGVLMVQSERANARPA